RSQLPHPSVESPETEDGLDEGQLKTLYTEAGQHLLLYWNMPVSICRAVGEHQSSQVLNGFDHDPDLQLAAIVALANLMSNFSVFPRKTETADRDQDKGPLSVSLGLDPTDREQIELALPSVLKREAEMLEIDVGPPETLKEGAYWVLYKGLLNKGLEPSEARAAADVLTQVLVGDQMDNEREVWEEYERTLTRYIAGRLPIVRDTEIPDEKSTDFQPVLTLDELVARLEDIADDMDGLRRSKERSIDLCNQIRKRIDDVETDTDQDSVGSKEEVYRVV
ncbi:MAG: hypothetical protein OEV80_13500, partial [candidate division Zixibacteria bacterium]|nr:hypothetical protein [candidate division Zixibacteria bacterium]